MDVAVFEDLIDRLGHDLSLWPEDQRAAATVLLQSSDEAKRLHTEACLVRAALTAAPVRAPAGLADRIGAAARRLKAEEDAVQTVTADPS